MSDVGKRTLGPVSPERRQLLAGLGLVGLAAAIPMRSPLAANGLVAVELFTSQGCSSCPPAERLLAELADGPDIVALSYHVQYWDHIGWRDPYGDPRCQQRQEYYRTWLKTRFLYTPQMIIAGRYDVVGSRRSEVTDRIRQAGEEPQIAMQLMESHVGPSVKLPASSVGPKGAVLLAVRYLKEAVTRVERGENAGRTLKERNIVRDLQRLTVWAGEERMIPLPESHDREHGQAVLLQDLEDGRILAAAKRPPLFA